jgi:hypothetical protein
MTEWLLQPPEIKDVEEPVIFLAGPIQGAPDWQNEAARRIHRLAPHVLVASPRKEYLDGTFVHEKQVDWETYHLRAAGRLGVVAFWLARQAEETPGRAYAQTTRFELAEWKMRHQYEGAKLTVGIEEGFGNERYIRRRFSQDCPSVQITRSLAAMCHNAVELATEHEIM